MRLLKLAKIMIAAAAAVSALSVNSYAGVWMHDNNGWWYCNDNRSYTTDNWQQINGAWYYFDPWGYMVTGWKQVGGSWYYLHADGKMAHDTWIDGTYYVGTDGRMLTNTTTPDGYRVGADGKWTNKQQTNTGGRDFTYAKYIRNSDYEWWGGMSFSLYNMVERSDCYEAPGVTLYWTAEFPTRREAERAATSEYPEVFQNPKGTYSLGGEDESGIYRYPVWTGSCYIRKDATISYYPDGNAFYPKKTVPVDAFRYNSELKHFKYVAVDAVDANGYITALTLCQAG